MGLLNGLKSVGGWFKGSDTEERGQKEGEFYVDKLDGEAEGSPEMAVAAQPWFEEFDLSDEAQANTAR